MSSLLRERFSKPVDAFAEKFVASTKADEQLVLADIEGSIAHTKMLTRQGILTQKDGVQILQGLDRVKKEYESGDFVLDVSQEDVHMNVESRLGEVGAKLHAARSRNDQVALDMRLWLKDQIRALLDEIMKFQGVLRRKAIEEAGTVMPGVTHLQHAQPIVFGHALLSFKEAVERDYRRLEDCLKRTDVSPLGACAMAGTSLPTNPSVSAQELGMSKVFANSIDAVSDRDFAAEFTFCCSLIVTHLSQIAENLIIWSTPEFGFIELPDELCTSSSIMPQKKNPDLVELVRGKAGAVYGQLVNLLTTLKALPLGYNRDLQETKPPVFEVAETTRHSLQAIHMAIEGLEVNRDRMREEADDYQLLAADLAEYLAAKGVPFREAHGAVARLMKGCVEEGVTPNEMNIQKLRSFHPKFQGDVLDILTPEASVAGKVSPGGTAPANVERSA
ncbi:MAG: argininosuccinate lyase [Planctomycetota bacterium]|nr:argininosuccinate lyase [Planctomycetota bacterium]